MPAMPRMRSKATRIAYKILGIPANIAFRRNEVERKTNRRLIFEETSRVR